MIESSASAQYLNTYNFIHCNLLGVVMDTVICDWGTAGSGFTRDIGLLEMMVGGEKKSK